MTDRWTALIALHAVGATVALVLGAYLILRRRKGDLLHRRLGRIWMADMYWVAFSSFGIQRLSPGHFSWIHGLSAWTIFSLTMAIRAARARRIQQHRGWVVGTYCGLVGAGIGATAVPTRLVPETAAHHPVWLVSGLVSATILAIAAIELAARLPARRGSRAIRRTADKVSRTPSAVGTSTGRTPTPQAVSDVRTQTLS